MAAESPLLSVRDIDLPGITSSRQYHPSPKDWSDEVLYFLLPDRFSDGTETEYLDVDGNTVRRPGGGGTPPFNRTTDDRNALSDAQGRDTSAVWRDAGTRFAGGTLRGAVSKLGYLKRLGVTAIWVGPVFKQVPRDPSLYHGYAVQDFLQVEPRFGTKEDLRALVEGAHREGIYVILDIILNHVGNVFAYDPDAEPRWDGGRTYPVAGFRNPDAPRGPFLPFRPMVDPDNRDARGLPKNYRDCAIWPVELQQTDAFNRKGSIGGWENFPEYFAGDFGTLKDINLGDFEPDGFRPTAALKALAEVYKYWIAYADLDGYRIDTVKHMGNGPTRYFASVIHEFTQSIGKEQYLLVGEITGSEAFKTVEVTGINAALGLGGVQRSLWCMAKGKANPQEYFGLFRNAEYLNKGSMTWLRNKIVTMVDDHDQVWRDPQRKGRFCEDPEGARLVFAALALNLCTLGIPCIYYGSEQGFDGAGGPDGGAPDRYIREAMFGGEFGAFRSRRRHFFDESGAVFRELRKVADLRRKEIALRRGRQYLREISGDGVGFGYPTVPGGSRMKSVLAWSRVFDEAEAVEVVCAINTDDENETTAWVTVDGNLHPPGRRLTCMYPKGDARVWQQLTVEPRNGSAVLVKVPPGGFVMYK